VKHLVTVKGFNAYTLSFTSFFFVGLIQVGILFHESYSDEFKIRNVLIGSFGSFINSIGTVLIGKACTLGPIGAVNALVGLNTLMFATYEVIYSQKTPLPFEVIGIIIGILGALIISVPESMSKVLKSLKG
jgi:hypothetical protein